MKRWLVRCTVAALAVGILAAPANRALAGPTAPRAARTEAMASTAARAQVVAGEYAGYAIKPDGSLWAWGDNSFGQLGLGDYRNRHVPTRVGRSIGWATIAAGEHCLAIRRDGSLWAWGDNDMGQLGLNLKNNHGQPSPRRVGTGLWKAVGVGFEFSVAIRRDGSLWAWGNNENGDLGMGNHESGSPLRRRVGTDSDWKAIAVGYDWVIALKSDGSLWSWGEGVASLGLGTSDGLAHPTPARIGSDSDWTAVAGGRGPTFALKRDGSLWAWGGNGQGALGVGDTADRLVPTRVGTGTTWKTVVAGQVGGLALQNDGSLWSWGDNSSGQLGLGTTDDLAHPTPTRVGTGTQWVKIAAGNVADLFSLGLKANGSFWAWGSDLLNQLGLKVRHSHSLPTRIAGL